MHPGICFSGRAWSEGPVQVVSRLGRGEGPETGHLGGLAPGAQRGDLCSHPLGPGLTSLGAEDQFWAYPFAIKGQASGTH